MTIRIENFSATEEARVARENNGFAIGGLVGTIAQYRREIGQVVTSDIETGRSSFVEGSYANEYVRARKFLLNVSGFKPFSPIRVYAAGTEVTGSVYPVRYVAVTYTSGSPSFIDIEDQINVSSANVEFYRNDLEMPTSTRWDIGELARVNNQETRHIVVVFAGKKRINNVDTDVIGYINYSDNDSKRAEILKGNIPPPVSTNATIRAVGQSLSVSDSIIGLLSGAAATVTAIIPSTKFADAAGRFIGVLKVGASQVKSGEVIVEVVEGDLATRARNAPYARGSFIATGTTNLIKTVIFTRETGNVVGTGKFNTAEYVAWVDPLAQSFLIQAPDNGEKLDFSAGAFITKVDLFFRTKADSEEDKIQVQLCEMVNGYPSPKVLPNAEKIITPSVINVSQDGSAVTTVTFPMPVYVLPNTEYCLKLITTSNEYEVFIARKGEVDISGTRMITDQPYMGSLFKSQNNSTWTAEQNEDLSFRLYHAIFNTQSSVVMDIDQNGLITRPMPVNPFKMTSGNTLVRVNHPNHGFVDGMRVKYFGISGTVNVTNDTEYQISNSTIDTYTIVGTAAGSTGFAGGSLITCSANIKADAIYLNLPYDTPAGTSLIHSYFINDGQSNTSKTYTEFNPNKTVEFNDPKFILSKTNETYLMGGASSFTYRALLGTSNRLVTPYLSVDALNFRATNNRIDYPAPSDAITEIDFTAYDANGVLFQDPENTVRLHTMPDEIFVGRVVMFTKIGGTNDKLFGTVIDIDFATNTLYLDEITNVTTGNAATLTDSGSGTWAADATSTVTITKTTHGLATNDQIPLVFSVVAGTNATSGSYTITVVDPDTFTVTNIDGVLGGTNNGTVIVGEKGYLVNVNDLYIDEIAPSIGFGAARYQNKPITLDQLSTSLHIFFAASIPDEADIELYYRAIVKNDFDTIYSHNWAQIPTNYVKSGRRLKFTDQEYALDNIPAFNQFQLKVVFKSTNSAQIPRLKDFRAIALA